MQMIIFMRHIRKTFYSSFFFFYFCYSHISSFLTDRYKNGISYLQVQYIYIYICVSNNTHGNRNNNTKWSKIGPKTTKNQQQRIQVNKNKENEKTQKHFVHIIHILNYLQKQNNDGRAIHINYPSLCQLNVCGSAVSYTYENV